MTATSPLQQRCDQLVVTMARHVAGHPVAVQGLNTPLATAALLLAKCLHAPDVLLLYTDGGVVDDQPRALTAPGSPPEAASDPLRDLPFAELICELVPAYHPLEFMRPAQLDRLGNANSLWIDLEDRRLALPGPAGMCDASSENRNLAYYLPRHDSRALVAQVDVIATPGRSVSDADVGGLPQVPNSVFTELCVLGLGPDGFYIDSLYPGVVVDEVAARTGFALAPTGDVQARVPPPARDELEALSEIDPRRLRDLEMLGTRDRVAALRAIDDKGALHVDG